MPILSIDRYFVGDPNIVGITTTDGISTITAVDYWKTQLPIVAQLINGVFQWSISDLVLIYYATNQVGFFTYDPVNLTFAELVVPGDVSSITGTVNQVLVNGTSGIPKTGPVTLTLPQNIDILSTPSFANVIFGYATTSTAAGTTTLTATSEYLQYFTGTSTQTVVLPVTSTLKLGQSYLIINNSSGNVTVNSSGGNLIQVMSSGTNLFLTCTSLSGTTASSWNASYNFENSGVDTITGTANQVTASSPTGFVTLSLPQDIATGSTPTFLGLTAGNLNLLGNSLISTNSNGNINLIPNGSGQILGLGSTSYNASPGMQIHAISNESAYSAASYTNTAGNSSKLYFYKSRSTSVGGFSALSAGDDLGIIVPFGADGSAFIAAASIKFLVGGTVSSGIVSGAMEFATKNSAGALTLAASISDAQVFSLVHPLLPTYGGTGVANLVGSTLTLGGALVTSGAFASTFTMTNTTSVTFPTSGTLATTAQLPTPAALTKTDDTNVTLTLGGTPTTALLQATSLTLGWTGQLAVSRGGTGISSFGTGVATALGQNVNGSGAIALTTSPTFVTPVLGAASATSLSFSSTSGIIGTTTNNNAAALSVGEQVISTVDVSSPVSLSTLTNANITSISLTAGDWDVYGMVGFTPAATTNIVQTFGWTSSTSATLPSSFLYAKLQNVSTGLVLGSTFSYTVPMMRVSLASTTTIYLSARASFSIDTLGAFGKIEARRRR